MSTCNAVGQKTQGRWGRGVRCWRSLLGTLAPGPSARPFAALEFAPGGRWVPKGIVKSTQPQIRDGSALSEVLLTSGSGFFGLLKFLKTTMCQVSSQKTFCPEPTSVVTIRFCVNRFRRNQEHFVWVWPSSQNKQQFEGGGCSVPATILPPWAIPRLGHVYLPTLDSFVC